MSKLDEIENCITCEHCSIGPINASSLEKLHICILNPPTVQAVTLPQGIAHVTAFPQVNEKMICSFYQAKPMILSIVD